MSVAGLMDLENELLNLASQAERAGLHDDAASLRAEAMRAGDEAEAALDAEMQAEADDRYLDEMAMMGEL